MVKPEKKTKKAGLTTIVIPDMEEGVGMRLHVWWDGFTRLPSEPAYAVGERRTDTGAVLVLR